MINGPVPVLLADAAGPKVLGMRVRDRNERVVSRSANAVVASSADESDSRVLFVPEHVVLEPSLFELLRELNPPLRLSTPEGAKLDWGAPSKRTSERRLVDDHFLDASNASSRKRAERLLLLRTEKSTDGWVSRTLNRPQSRFFSRWFLKAGLSPNAASAVSLAIGLGCGFAAAQPGGLWLALTGFLFQFASMFDGVDGEMARVSLRDSKTGAAIDSLVDNVTYLATLVGFGVGWAREGITAAQGWMLVLLLAMVILTLLWVLIFVRSYGDDMSFVFFDRSLRRAAKDSQRASLRAIDVFFRATRRDMLALILMLVSFVGSRFLIFCLLGVGVLVADYVLLFHRHDLIRAAGLLRTERQVG